MADPFEEWLVKQQTEHPFGAVKPEWATQLIQLGASWDTFRRSRGFELIVKELMDCSAIPLLAARDIVRLAQEELKRCEAPMAVFWDLQGEVPTVETIRRLKTMLAPFGNLVQCRCYGHPAIISAQQRAALQLAGCIVMDTVLPQQQPQQAGSSTTDQEADKGGEGSTTEPAPQNNALMITVDAMQFAYGHPDGAALCFVTGDADQYSYLLETLRQKPNHCWRTITITKKPPSKHQVVHKCWQTSDILRGSTAVYSNSTHQNSNTSTTRRATTNSSSDNSNNNQYPSTSQKTVSFDDSQLEQTTYCNSGAPMNNDISTNDNGEDGDNHTSKLLEWIKSRNNGTAYNHSVGSSVAESSNSSQNNDTIDYDEEDGTEFDHDDLMSLLTQEEFDFPYHLQGDEAGESSNTQQAEDEDYDEADPGNETWKADIGYLKALVKRYSKSPLFAVRKTHVIGLLRLRNSDRFPRKRLLAVLDRAIEMGVLAETEYEESPEEGIVQLISLPEAKSSIARPPLAPVDAIPPEILEFGIPHRVVKKTSSMPFTLLAPKRSFPSGTIIPKGVFVVNAREWLFLMFRTRSDAQRTVDEDLPRVFGKCILIDWRQHPEALEACNKWNNKGEEEQQEKGTPSREHRKNEKQSKGPDAAVNIDGGQRQKREETKTMAKITNNHQGKHGKQVGSLSNKSNKGDFGDENSSTSTQQTSTIVADKDHAALNEGGQQQRGQRECARSRGQAISPTQGEPTRGPSPVSSIADEKTSVDHEKADDAVMAETEQVEDVDSEFGALSPLTSKKKEPATHDEGKKGEWLFGKSPEKDNVTDEVETRVTESSDSSKVEDEEEDEAEDDWEDVEEDANCGRCGTTLLESDVIFAPKETSTSGGGRDITCIKCYPWKGDDEKLQATNRVVSLLIMMAEYDDIYVESETLKKQIHRGFPGYCTTVKHAELWIGQAVKSNKVSLFEHKQLAGTGTFYCLADNLPFADRDFPRDDFNTAREENHINNLLVKASSPICRKDAIMSLAAKFTSMQTPFLRSRVFINGEQKGKFFLVKDSFNQAIGFTEHEARAFLTKLKRTHLATSRA